MALPKSILRGYDKYTEKIVAQALGIPVPKHKRHKGGEHRMKIPMSALKNAKNEKAGGKKKPGMKFGALKGKKKPSDNDGDE